MAIAYSRVSSRPDLGVNVVDVTLDGSYSAGGYALDNAQLGMLRVEHISCEYKHATATSTNVAEWDRATNKLKVFESGGASAPLVECIAGDLTSSHVVRLEVRGTPRL